MKDDRKTKKQLIEELRELRGRLRPLRSPGERRRPTREQPAETSRLYRGTIDSLDDILHVVDADLRITLHNKAFTRWCTKLGLRKRAIGRRVFEVFPFLSQKVGDEYRRVFKTGKTLVTEEHTSIKGKLYITETRKIPVREDGKVVRVTTIIRDITEQRRAEQELRESEEKFKSFAERSPNMIFINKGGRIVYVNPKSEDVMGYGREEFYAAGFDFRNLIEPGQRRNADEIFQQHLAGKETPPQEYTLITKAGQRIEVIITSKLITYEGQQSILGIVTDITERRRIENELEEYKDHLEDLVTTRTLELRETNEQLHKEVAERKKIQQDLEASEEKFKAQYKAIPVPTFTWQRKGNDFIFVDYNDEAYRFTGGSIDDYLGVKASKLYRDNPRIRREMRKCYLEKTTIERDLLYHMDSLGEDKYLAVKYAYVPPDLVLVHTEDITERRRNEEEIKKQKSLLDEVFDGIQEGIAIVDKEETILFCNPAFSDIFEIDQDRLVGENLSNLFPSDAQEILQGEMIKRKSGETSTYELPLVTPRGKRKHIRITASPRYGEDGSYQGSFGAILDITDRKQAEQELQDAKDYLQILFDFAPEAYYLTDKKGRFVDGNRAAEELSGYNKEELIGKDVIESGLLPPEEQSKAISMLTSNVQGEGTGPMEFTILRKDGTRVAMEITSFPVKIKGHTLILNIGRDIRERKKAEAKLRASQKRFRNTFDLAAVGITHISLDGRFLEVNPRFCDIVEYGREELLGMRFQDITHPDDIKRNLKSHRQLVKGELAFFTLDKRYISKSGLPVWVNISAALVRDENGKPDYLISVADDIGDRKWAEQEQARSEELHKILFEYAPDGYFLTDIDGRLVNCNRAAEELTGIGRGKLRGERWLRFFTGDNRKKAAAMISECARGRDVGRQELLLNRKDTDQIIVEVSAFSVKIWDQTFILHVARDITSSKRDEKALRESEKRYRTLFNGAAEGILVADIKTRKLLYCNSALSKMLGYTQDEIRGMKVSDIHPKKTLKNVIAEFEALAYKEKTLAANIPCVRKDGKIIYADIHETRMQIDGKMCNVGFFVDITERKLAEEKLHESEETARALMNSTDDSAILSNTRGHIIALNEAAARRFGKCVEDIIGTDGFSLMPPMLARSRKQKMRQVVRTKKPVRFRDKRGDIFFDTTIYPVIDANGQVTRVATYGRDITTEVKAKQALQQSEQKYRELAELLPVTVFELDLKGNIITTNRAGLEAFGYTQEDIDKGLNVNTLYVPEDRKRIRGNIAKRLRGEVFEDHEYMALRKDGTTFPVIIFSSVILRDGKSVGLRGIVVDISDRKAAEQYLVQSERRYRELTELLPQIVFEIDLQGNLLSVNQYWFEATGYTLGDFGKGINISQLIVPEDVARARKNFKRTARGEESEDHEFTAVRKDGSTYPILVYSNPILRDGKSVGLRGVILDISDIRLAEKELRTSEAKFRGIAENILDAIFSTDEHGRLTYVSPAIEHIIGYRSEECVGKLFHSFLHPRDIPQAVIKFNQTLKGSRLRTFQLDMLRKDKSIVCTELSATPMWVDGHVVGTQGVIRDIAERISHIAQMEASEEKYRSMVELAPDIIITVNDKGIITSCNSAFESQFGLQIDRTIGNHFLNIPTMPPKRRSKYRKLFATLMGSRNLKPFEIEWEDRAGAMHSFEVHATFLRSGRKKTGLLAILRDITKRRRVEEELRTSGNNLRALVDLAPDSIITFDSNGFITACNKAALDISGYRRESELVGKHFTKLKAFSKKDLVKLIPLFAKAIKGKPIPPVEFNFRHKDGTIRWAEGRHSLLREGSKITGILAVIRDISERKRKEGIERAIYDISSAVNSSKDLLQFYKSIHRTLSRLLKTKNLSISLYNHEEDTFSVEYHVDERDSYKGTVPAGKTLTAHMIKSGSAMLLTREDVQHLKLGGKVKPIGAATKVWLGVPLKVKGKIIGALVVSDYHDVHAFDQSDLELLEFVSGQIALSIQRKRIEENLKDSEELFRTLAENSPHMILVNAFGSIIYANRKCQEVLEYRRKEFYSPAFNFVSLIAPEERERIVNLFERHRRGEDIPPYQCAFLAKGGRKIELLCRVKLIKFQGKSALLHILSEIS